MRKTISYRVLVDEYRDGYIISYVTDAGPGSWERIMSRAGERRAHDYKPLTLPPATRVDIEAFKSVRWSKPDA